jgi:hypothetical protein
LLGQRTNGTIFPKVLKQDESLEQAIGVLQKQTAGGGFHFRGLYLGAAA